MNEIEFRAKVCIDGRWIKGSRSCAECEYYSECVKGNTGDIPADACDF